MSKRSLILLGLLVVAGGLMVAFLMRPLSPRQRAEKVLRKVGPGPLREAAAALYKDMFAASVHGYLVVKDTSWPKQFSAFAPSHVGAWRDGFALALTRDHDTESGIYVIPAHSDLQPRATTRSRFERMADGIYWYSFDQ
jgi:hypothetical protein